MFGSGSDWATIVKKMLFDQLVWAPLSNYVLVVVLAWREEGFTRSALRHMLSLDYISQRYMPDPGGRVVRLGAGRTGHLFHANRPPVSGGLSRTELLDSDFQTSSQRLGPL